jgi:tyrosine-specific transport protein
VPGAFIKALSFAGMVLVVIAILLPQYLFYKGRRSGAFKTLHYPIVGNPFFQGVCTVVGGIIMLFEVMHLIGR